MNEKHVKTKKVVKRRLKTKRVFILALVLICFILLVNALGKVNVSNITVTGNEYVSNGAIIKAAKLNNKVSFLKLKKKDACDGIKKMSLISDCHIKRKFNFSIEIEVVENKPLFYYLSDKKLILSDGTMLEEGNTYGVPTLINSVPEKILSEFISGLSSINSDIIRSVSEIEYTPSTNSAGAYIDEERFMLSMNDGNIVYVNNRHISSLAYYEKIYASIGDKKGYYNCDCEYNTCIFNEFE